MAKVTIIGAGAMGSALTRPLVDNGHEVHLWGTELDDNIITALKNGEPHPKHKEKLPIEVHSYYKDEIDQALKGAKIVILAITSDALLKIFKGVRPFLTEESILVTVSKGFDYKKDGNIAILPEILEEALPEHLQNRVPIIAVGGPCKAIEVLWKSPTSVTYAGRDLKALEFVKETIETDFYNVEITEDVVGTEVSAAMKNAYAVGLGMAEGFKELNGYLHNNTKSAIFTFAIKEMIILSEALGGSYLSVIGLPGVGDLEVTGEAGRNRILGEVVGSGVRASEAVEKMKKDDITVEGYPAIEFGLNLVKQLEREGKTDLSKFPLLETLYNIMYKDEESRTNITKILKQCTNS